MVITLLSVLIFLVSVTLIVLVVGLVLFARQMNRAMQNVAEAAKDVAGAARDVGESVRAARTEIVPLAADIRDTLTNLDGLVSTTRTQVDTVGRIAGTVEHFIEGAPIVSAAGKAVASSRTTVAAVLEGLKEGLKALKRSKGVQKEEPSDG